MKKYLKHFITVTKHKYYVMKYCFKCGIYKRGLLHDLSKYGKTEFCSSARYFQGNSSPIDAEKKEKSENDEEKAVQNFAFHEIAKISVFLLPNALFQNSE